MVPEQPVGAARAQRQPKKQLIRQDRRLRLNRLSASAPFHPAAPPPRRLSARLCPGVGLGRKQRLWGAKIGNAPNGHAVCLYV